MSHTVLRALVVAFSTHYSYDSTMTLSLYLTPFLFLFLYVFVRIFMCVFLLYRASTICYSDAIKYLNNPYDLRNSMILIKLEILLAQVSLCLWSFVSLALPLTLGLLFLFFFVFLFLLFALPVVRFEGRI